MRVAILAVCFVLAAAGIAPAAPGYCQVEIVNRSHHDVLVDGAFDDGSRLPGFRMYSNETAHYIDLHYHGYCHSALRLEITSLQVPHRVIYEAWTHVNTTVHIVPY